LEEDGQAVNLNPLHIEARINQAVTYREQCQYDGAIAGLEEALLFDRLLGRIYAERGRTYHIQGDWNGAIADYRCALDCWACLRDRHTSSPAKAQPALVWLHQLQAVPEPV
jgi:tetratricopeptide (TPR) repeat protein